MDISYPAEAESFRAEVRTVLAEELPPGWPGIGAIAGRQDAERFAAQWRQVLYRRGLLGITWPLEYGGRGLSRLHQVVLMEELARAGVPFGEHTDLFGIKMLGSTLLRWGTPEQRRRFLPRILSGEDRWCQGFSEPGAGSDLASLTTRATLDGGEWVIDGQKVWTSVAHRANWIFLLARTDPRPAATGVSRSCSARSISRASRSGRSDSSPGTAISTRCSSPAPGPPPTWSSVPRARAGRWP